MALQGNGFQARGGLGFPGSSHACSPLLLCGAACPQPSPPRSSPVFSPGSEGRNLPAFKSPHPPSPDAGEPRASPWWQLPGDVGLGKLV